MVFEEIWGDGRDWGNTDEFNYKNSVEKHPACVLVWVNNPSIVSLMT